MSEHQPRPTGESEWPQSRDPRETYSPDPNASADASAGSTESQSPKGASQPRGDEDRTQGQDRESSGAEQTDRHEGVTHATPAEQSSSGRSPNGNGTDGRQADLTSLLPDRDLDAASTRWHEIQSAFVDDPRRAISDADALVGEVLKQLMSSFDAERTRFEALSSSDGGASTEELRVSLQRYRDFFQRLLSA